MNEIKLSHMSQTTINFNEMNSPINLKFSFLKADRMNGINNNEDNLKKKSIEKLTQQQIRKNLIRTRSDNYFKQFNFGVPRYHDFNPRYSYVKIKNFLNEKIVDKETKIPKPKNQTSQEEIYDGIDNYFDNQNIGNYKNNHLNNKLLSNRNYKDFDNKINNLYNEDKNDFQFEENNNESLDKNIKPNELKEHKNNFFQVTKTHINKSIPKLNFDFTEKKEISKNNNANINLNNRSLNDRDPNIIKNGISLKGKNTKLNHKRSKLNVKIQDSDTYFSCDKFAIKDNQINNSYKNSREIPSEKSITFMNSHNFFQNSNNEINEYEDLLDDKVFKKKLNSYRENLNDCSLDKKNKDEITNITYKNFNTSFSKDYNITFLKKQNEREKNITYEINRLKMGSEIPQISKEFYLLNYNEVLEKEKIRDKEKKIKEKHSPDELIKTFTRTNLKNLFKRTNQSDYLKFEKKFSKDLLKTKIREDKLEGKRNFNYYFDSEKYSTALQINSLVNFPVIISDPKNFEEILNRNTNNILERGNKLQKK